MNDLIFNTVYFLSNIFSVFFISKFMSVFFDRKRPFSRLSFILIYSLYPVLTSITYWLFDIPILNLTSNIICLFIITSCYSSTLKRRVFSVCFIYVFMFITEAIVAGITGYTQISSILHQGSYSVEVGIIVTRILLYFESILLQNFKSIKNNTIIPSVFWISSFLIPFSSIYIIVVIFSSENIKQLNVVVNTAIVFLVNILVFYLYDALSSAYNEKMKTMIFKQEKEYYYNQCKIMKASTEDLRAFRHEIKNHLLTLANYINADKLVESNQYINNLIGDVECNVAYSTTGNIAFDSIINYKLRNSKDIGINVIVEIGVPKDFEMNLVDIVVIMGNLLDNAINALHKVDDKILILKVNYSKGRILIYLENTFDGYIRYVDNEIATTHADKTSHGYGLKNVRRTIEKYNGILEITHTETKFITSVMLYLAS